MSIDQNPEARPSVPTPSAQELSEIDTLDTTVPDPTDFLTDTPTTEERIAPQPATKPEVLRTGWRGFLDKPIGKAAAAGAAVVAAGTIVGGVIYGISNANSAPDPQVTNSGEPNPSTTPDMLPSETPKPEVDSTQISTLEKSPEQLQAEYTIPSTVAVEDLPSAFIDKMNAAQNGGANPIDVPAQNWQPDDPVLAEIASKIDTAASMALYGSTDNVGYTSLKEGHVSLLYYYGVTSFEQQIYPGTKPYKVTTRIIDTPSITDLGDGTFDLVFNARLTDNALENSVQNQARKQGDLDGKILTEATIHLQASINGDRWVFIPFEATTTLPNS